MDARQFPPSFNKLKLPIAAFLVDAAAHQVLASLVVRSFRCTVFASALSLSLRDFDLLLDDLHSFSTHLDDLPARCWILS